MAVPASLRAPIPVVPGLQSSQLQVEDRFASDGSLRLSYVGDAADGLRLNPMFPGRLAFKPSSPASIPLDPSAAGAAAVPGQLFLSLSPRRLDALAKKEPSLRYPLLLIYHDVALDPEFFTGTVVAALTRPSDGFRRVMLNGQRLDSAAELSHAFAAGQLDFWIFESGDYRFPLVPPGLAGNERSIDLTLGVPTHFNPFHRPPPLSQLPPGTVSDPASFVPLPLCWWVSRLRQLSAWEQLLHDDFIGHPFWDAVVAATPDYRRLRVFLPGDRPATGHHIKAYDQLLINATAADGSPAWSTPVNRLGDLYLTSDPSVDLMLEAEFGGLPVALGEEADATPGDAQIPWPAAATPTASQASDLDLSVELDLHGDPLTLQPPVPLYRGLRDQRGLTIDRRQKRVVAEQELVQPLQTSLGQFGWAPPDTGIFGRKTRSAVRGFQRQAGSTNRLDADGTVDPATVTAWDGEVSGTADAATLAEMRLWRDNDYRSAASDRLWVVTHQWSDLLPSSTKSYAANYHGWVNTHLKRFNNTKLMCNWFPILLLIEYAAAHGLRIKLRYWSPTNDPDMSPIHSHDSHGGQFSSKSQFYRATKRSVTSRMIGQLNTDPVPQTQRNVGDIIVLDYGEEFFTWHSYVITKLLGGAKCHLQSGSIPAVVPSSPERQSDIDALPSNAYENSYRRWKFADFD